MAQSLSSSVLFAYLRLLPLGAFLFARLFLACRVRKYENIDVVVAGGGARKVNCQCLSDLSAFVFAAVFAFVVYRR